jgi:hypothetical protein
MEIDHYFFFSEKKNNYSNGQCQGVPKKIFKFLPTAGGSGRILLTWPDPSPDNPR